MELEEDECVHVGSDTDFSVTPVERTSRPAGEKIQLQHDDFRMEYQPYSYEEEGISEQYYTIQEENLLGLGEAIQSETWYNLKVEGEEGYTPGFEVGDAVWLPEAPDVDGASDTLSFSRSSDLKFTMPAAGDDNGVYVTMMSMDSAAGEVDVESTILCRFKDDGDITIPSSSLQNLNSGEVYMQVFRAGYGYVKMPTGYVTRTTTMNSTIIMGEAQ